MSVMVDELGERSARLGGLRETPRCPSSTGEGGGENTPAGTIATCPELQRVNSVHLFVDRSSHVHQVPVH